MPQVKANGLDIEVVETGPKDGHPLLLVQGWTCQLLNWHAALIDGLAGRGYRVIRFDNRDCGLSQKFSGVPDVLKLIEDYSAGRTPEAPYTLNDMAKDAVGVLDALDIDTAHIAGFSMGGMIAQIVAGRHGNRARSLTSIMSTSGDPSVGQADDEIMAMMFAPPPDPSDREACVTAKMLFWRSIGSPAYPAGDAELRALCEAEVDRSYSQEANARQLAAIVASGSREALLKTVRVPTLVIHGEDDRLVNVSGGQHVADLVPDADIMRIPGLGHDLTAANAPIYLREMGGFIDRVENQK